MAEPLRPPFTAPATADRPLLIVGGGFGGLYTALALASHRHHPPILLVEPNERFLFLPLLYELLSQELRSWEVAPRYDTLLAGRGVAWLRDRVVQIDADDRSVRTAGGRTLAYARLVIATGARSESFGVPGVEEHALGFRTLADVERLQLLVERLLHQPRPLQRLALVGGGPSGVELACKLADLLRGTTVLELIEQGADLLPQARAFNRDQAGAALLRRDVRVRTHTRVRAVGPGSISLGLLPTADAAPSHEDLAVDGVLWTAGVAVTPPPITPAPPIDGRGRLLCTSELQLRDQPEIFALGDVAHVPDADGVALPGTAQVAFQQAERLAANLLLSLDGQPLEPFRWKDLGEMISLGVGEATLTGLGLTLAGPAAFRIRQIAYLSRLPGLPHQLRVAAGWLSDLGRPVLGGSQAARP